MLEEELQDMLNINVKQEFVMKNFQNATKKIISEKRTLNFSPNLLNQKLKSIQMKKNPDIYQNIRNMKRASQEKDRNSPSMDSARNFGMQDGEDEIPQVQTSALVDIVNST